MIKHRCTVADFMELARHAFACEPLAFTTAELDALWLLIKGYPRYGQPVDMFMGRLVVEVPNWAMAF